MTMDKLDEKILSVAVLVADIDAADADAVIADEVVVVVFDAVAVAAAAE